ncbi:MAG: TldD/PmbA family protein [candidate division WOR-3 bacterium]|nr:TldD/PmbA family protein [candidate division WOR-3 bacterium]
MDRLLNDIIDNLKLKKISYGDVRLVEEETESILVKNGIIEALTHTFDTGFGVRVLKDNAWGFASSNLLKKAETDRIVRKAIRIAEASAKIKGGPVVLSPLEPQKGSYKTDFKLDPFKVSLTEKIDLLLKSDRLLGSDPRIKNRTSFMSFRRVRVHFYSTEGSKIFQEFIYVGGGIKAFAMDKGELQIRSYDDYGQSGYEFIKNLKLVENAERVREEAIMLLSAKPCPTMKTTIILDSNQMVLQVHESCGHPTELDRVLGTEASYAGTSFMTPDKLNNLKYGSDIVNIVADATIPGGLGTFGWDDEGVPAQKVYLIKNGIFVGYQSSRETAPVVNVKSSGNMRADGWNRIPLIRMTNINLLPGEWKLEDMIADTKEGIFMTTNKSWSIDDKRLNFQFGCELARKIENGKLTEVYKNPTYADITPQFWNKCDAIANKDYWHLYGVPNCGKGEPGQTMYVGHATAPARFRDVQVGIAR